jgi:putative transposase
VVAVREWFRRSVRSWAVAITRDVGLCLAALDHALEGAQADIFHRDPGAQCTSLDGTGRLASGGRQLSMDGRGRARANGCGERLWRTVQYEEG